MEVCLKHMGQVYDVNFSPAKWKISVGNKKENKKEEESEQLD